MFLVWKDKRILSLGMIDSKIILQGGTEVNIRKQKEVASNTHFMSGVDRADQYARIYLLVFGKIS